MGRERDETINVSLTESEKKEIYTYCHERGIAMSRLLVRLALKHIQEQKEKGDVL